MRQFGSWATSREDRDCDSDDDTDVSTSQDALEKTSAAQRDAEAGRVWLRLAGILVLALTLRVLAHAATAATRLLNDEWDYFGLAARLMQTGELGDAAGRAPGVVVFYSSLFSLFGPLTQVARAGNVLLSTASVGLVFLLGRRFAGVRAGLLAALLAALYPNFIGFSHSLWPETLYIFLELAALVLLAVAWERPALWRFGAAGLLFGLGALTREVGALVALLMVAFVVAQVRPVWRAGLARGAVLLAAAAAVVLPWSAHLYAQTGQLALIGRTTWFNLYVGNAEPTEVDGELMHPWRRYRTLGSNRTEREAAARALALQAITDRMPAWPFEKLEEVRDFAAPGSFVVDRLRLRADPDRAQLDKGNRAYRFTVASLESKVFRERASLVCMLAYAVVVVSGVVGLILCGTSTARRASAVFIAAHLLPALATFALTRFRLPIMPLLILGAAALALALPRCWSEASLRRRLAAATAALTTLPLLL